MYGHQASSSLGGEYIHCVFQKPGDNPWEPNHEGHYGLRATVIPRRGYSPSLGQAHVYAAGCACSHDFLKGGNPRPSSQILKEKNDIRCRRVGRKKANRTRCLSDNSTEVGEPNSSKSPVSATRSTKLLASKRSLKKWIPGSAKQPFPSPSDLGMSKELP